MNCKCGFKFAGPGEFRNCNAFITNVGNSGVVCPMCNTKYVEIRGVWHELVEDERLDQMLGKEEI